MTGALVVNTPLGLTSSDTMAGEGLTRRPCSADQFLIVWTKYACLSADI